MHNKNEAKARAACVRRWGNVVLLLAFAACFPLGFALPQTVSWELGPLESFQNVTLVAGLIFALWSARKLSGQASAYLLAIAAIFWLGFFGREVSWGAVFLPPKGITQWGPSYIGYSIWWKNYVRGALAVLALVGVYWFFAKQLWRKVILRLAQEHALPVGTLVVFVLCLLTTINAEGHGFIHFQDWYGTQVMVLEELVETLAYVCLFWAQYLTVQHLRTWQRSSDWYAN